MIIMETTDVEIANNNWGSQDSDRAYDSEKHLVGYIYICIFKKNVKWSEEMTKWLSF